jgi:F0F1-type ATP synthase assembly protein I
MSMGLRAGSEFVSAILVGAGIGWALDRALGTNPAFLIVFFMIGVAAGVWNVIRVTSPKGGGAENDSRLSGAEAADKGLRRSAPEAAQDAAQRRGASGGAGGAPDGPDDDED